MKKYFNIYHSLRYHNTLICRDYIKTGISSVNSLIRQISNIIVVADSRSKRVFISIIFLILSFRVLAPGSNMLVITEPSGIKPFTDLMHAISMVETMGNPYAYNEIENAVGIFQIRQIRVDDYNRLTGSNYTLNDMFDHSLSEKVFLYFAAQVGPYNAEKIAKRWNGSGPRTELYWKRIKKYL